MLLQITEKKLVDSLNEGIAKTLIITSLNYEDRCLRLLDIILKTPLDKTRISFRCITLESQRLEGSILSQLKRFNINYATKKFKGFDYYFKKIPYPDDYNQRIVEDLLREWLQEYKGNPVNVLVDISGLPRSIILDIAEAIDKLGKVQNVFIAYTTATEYPSLRYPSNLGRPKGHFTKRPLSEMLSRVSRVEAVIFPGTQGFEGRLIYEELAEIEGLKHVFVLASGRRLLDSMTIMRTNLALLQQSDIDITFYFSIQDGIKKLTDIFEDNKRLSLNSIALIAPFGPKPLAWAAYLICKKLQNQRQDVKSEVVLLSAVQYSSVYSIGIGNTLFFRLQL